MFRRGRFIRLILAGFLIFVLFSLVSRSAYRVGWSRGYFTAQESEAVAPGPETAAPQPQGPAGYGYHGFGYGHWFAAPFFFVGGLFKLLFWFLLFGFLFKMFGFCRWRRHRSRHYGGPGHWHHGPKDPAAPHEKGPEDVEPDIRTV